GVSAHPDDDIGFELSQDAASVPDRPVKIEQSLQPGLKADFVEGAYLDQPKRESSRGHQPVLDAARRADKQHLCAILLLQFVGNGQSGNDVSAGAAPCQNCPHDLTINRKLRKQITAS